METGEAQEKRTTDATPPTDQERVFSGSKDDVFIDKTNSCSKSL